MANGITILMKIDECFPFYDNVQEAYKDLGEAEFCRTIYETVSDELLDNFPEVFSEIEEFYTYSIVEEWILGVEEAAKIQEYVEKWNENIYATFKRNFDMITEIMNEWKMPDLFSTFKRLSEQKEPAGFPFDTALYNFRKAVASLDDHIEYGSQCMVVYAADYGNEYSVLLPDKMMEDAKSNPEKYVFFCLYYD